MAKAAVNEAAQHSNLFGVEYSTSTVYRPELSGDFNDYKKAA